MHCSGFQNTCHCTQAKNESCSTHAKKARVPNAEISITETPGKANFGCTPIDLIYLQQNTRERILARSSHKVKGTEHENTQGPAGQVLGGRCDSRTSRVSHPPKSVIETVICRLRFVTCPGKNCDLPRVVLQKL